MSVENRTPDRPGADDPGRGRRLGIDVGTVRIGVAVSDPDGILATPVETVRRDPRGAHLRRIAALIGELAIVEVVVVVAMVVGIGGNCVIIRFGLRIVPLKSKTSQNTGSFG
jgi:hypothetical protein